MTKKYLYIVLLSLFAVSVIKAQTGSAFGSKTKGSAFGSGFSNNTTGGFNSPFGKKGNSSGSSNSGTSSQSKSRTAKKSSSTSKSNSGSSSKDNQGSSSKNSSRHSSGSSSASSGRVTSSSSLKKISGAHSYPGIGKSKVKASLKGGTKYSYPGVHNVKDDIAKLKKQGSTNPR